MLLIVEDDTALGEVLTLWCEDVKRNCKHVKTIKEAIECIKIHNPESILIDIFLQGEYGNSLIEYILEHVRPTPKIVAMSASKRAKEMVKNYPIAGFLEKPFEIEKLEELINL